MNTYIFTHGDTARAIIRANTRELAYDQLNDKIQELAEDSIFLPDANEWITETSY